MYKVGDIVVYKNDACRVKEIKENYLFDKDYYVMVPINDGSLKINVPMDCSNIRNVLTRKEAEELISLIPSIDIIEVNDKEIEYEYKRLMQDGSLESLIKVIKTTYLRNEDRLQQNKKIDEKDDAYFQKAERRLYCELSVSLDMSFDGAKQYVIDSVKEKLS